MTTKAKKRNRWKTPLIILGIMAALLLGFHFWFVRHAESLIEDLVRRQSGGKVELHVKNFKFNWFSKKMELEHATFFTTDTTAPVTYLFAVKRIRMEVHAIWPLLMEKRFYIDSLKLYDPDITVRKRGRLLQNNTDSSLSIPQEMGRIYHSIQDALHVLQVDRFQIINGSFTLSNSVEPGSIPLHISRINMYLDNLHIDTAASTNDQKILFSDNVALETHYQDILFPDGRHRLSFRDFRINTKNRLAEFDSCTIEATRGDSTRNDFRIFFEKLRMTNIDFDTLYHAEVIKADSVYAYSPRFQLNVDIPEGSPAGPPRLDELVQQLTGELDVAFVIVEDGSFDINTVRNNRPSSFTSDNNNFILEGLRIRSEGERPVSVERFEMAIRNYENFLRDSAYAIQFDSIRLTDNRISLSNFVYSELDGNNVVHNQLRMRQLELYGLSWDDLVFHQRLNAEQVTLIRPDIRYDFSKRNQKARNDLFETLAGLSRALQLERLHIMQGQVSLQLPEASQLKLTDATILLQTRQLLQATKVRDLRDAIQYLDFKSGTYQNRSLTAKLKDAQFIGGQNSALTSELIIEKKDSLLITASGVEAPVSVFDGYMQLQAIMGLKWKKATVKAILPPSPAGMERPLQLRDVKGGSTDLEIHKGDNIITGNLQQLNIKEWRSGPGGNYINGVQFLLSQLRTKGAYMELRVASWQESENKPSRLTDIELLSQKPGDSLHILLPHVSADFEWNDLLQGKYHLTQLTLDKPEITAHPGNAGEGILPETLMSIDELTIRNPVIRYTKPDDNGVHHFRWNGVAGDSIMISDFNLRGGSTTQLKAGNIRFHLRGMDHVSAKGKRFSTGRGSLYGEIQRFSATRNDLGSWDWRGRLEMLQARQFEWDSLGRRAGRLWLQSANIHHLNLQSSLLLDVPGLLGQNTDLIIKDITGSYIDSIDQFFWNNVSYDKGSQRLSLDSFRYTPAADLPTFLRRQKYQADYVQARTGKISLGPLALEQFSKDTILSIGTMVLEDGYLNDYRDKRIPREPGIVRALPGNLLRKLPFRFRSDTIMIRNARVDYEEVDEKTNKSGHIAVTELSGRLTHARNYDHHHGDSLRIYAEGKLADHIATRLWVKESYIDPDGGFRMRVEMDDGDLKVLNPILIALARAELRSGRLDSLQMDVQGVEAYAFGHMNLYYDDLKIKVIRANPRSLSSKLINLMANSLIRNRGRSKSRTVFVERLRDRSAINYLVKITLSGVMANAGIGKPAREARKNKKLLKKLQEKQKMTTTNTITQH